MLWQRNALLFVGISLSSGFAGTVMSLTAGVWAMSLSGSSSLAALAGLCVFLPTLLGPALGGIVDRLPLRVLLVATNLLTAGALVSLLTVRGSGQLWLIYVVMAVYGLCVVVLDSGESALLPMALPAGSWGHVNGLRMSAQEGTKLIAPLIGTALFAWRGGYPVAVLAAALFAGSAGLYLLIRSVRPAPPEPVPSPMRVRDAIAFLYSDRLVRTTVLIGAAAIAMSGLTTASLYEMVTVDLHRPASFVGVLASAQGAGSIVGGVGAGRAMRRLGELDVGVMGSMLFAVGCALRCMPWWPASVTSSVLIGIGLPGTLVAATTMIQVRTPAQMLGRVTATANSVLFAPIAVAIPMGAVVVLADRRLAFILAAAVCAATAAVARRRPRIATDDPSAVSV